MQRNSSDILTRNHSRFPKKFRHRTWNHTYWIPYLKRGRRMEWVTHQVLQWRLWRRHPRLPLLWRDDVEYLPVDNPQYNIWVRYMLTTIIQWYEASSNCQVHPVQVLVPADQSQHLCHDMLVAARSAWHWLCFETCRGYHWVKKHKVEFSTQSWSGGVKVYIECFQGWRMVTCWTRSWQFVVVAASTRLKQRLVPQAEVPNHLVQGPFCSLPQHNLEAPLPCHHKQNAGNLSYT